jgi:mRNA interferase MazF
MVIRQGDIYWIDLGDPAGSGPGYQHPHVVIQNDVFNQSRINTVIVCALTSNLKRAGAPGNIELTVGEGGLSKPSVVVVSQVFTVDKSQLEDPIGKLSDRRVRQILDGIALVLEPKGIQD